MYIKNGTYVNLNTWIFGIAVYSFIPENVQQLYLELDLKINFHWQIASDKEQSQLELFQTLQGELEII